MSLRHLRSLRLRLSSLNSTSFKQRNSCQKWHNRWLRQTWATRGLRPCKLSLRPHRETHWSRITGEVSEKFFIVFAVKICKQGLQTLLRLQLLEYMYFFPRPLPGRRLWTPLKNFRPPNPSGYRPSKIAAATWHNMFPLAVVTLHQNTRDPRFTDVLWLNILNVN